MHLNKSVHGLRRQGVELGFSSDGECLMDKCFKDDDGHYKCASGQVEVDGVMFKFWKN